MLPMGNLPKITRRDPFWTIQLCRGCWRSWCHALWKFENSKCCIFKTKNATGPKTGKRMCFLVIFYLMWIKNSESFAALILKFHDIKWKRPIYLAGLSLSTFFVVSRKQHRYVCFEGMLRDLKLHQTMCISGVYFNAMKFLDNACVVVKIG